MVRMGFLTPGLTLGHQGQLIVAGKEVWAVSDLFTATDPQLFEKDRAMGRVCEGEPSVARVGAHEEGFFKFRENPSTQGLICL